MECPSQRMSPCSSRIPTPNMVSPRKCRSIGLWPISHPPGNVHTACPKRASSGPNMKMEERSSLESPCGITYAFAAEVSSRSLSSSQAQRTPSASKIASMFFTSRSRGQSYSATGLSESRLAARIGSAAFFAPLTRIAPDKGVPPATINDAMLSPLRRKTAHSILMRQRGATFLILYCVRYSARSLPLQERS